MWLAPFHCCGTGPTLAMGKPVRMRTGDIIFEAVNHTEARGFAPEVGLTAPAALDTNSVDPELPRQIYCAESSPGTVQQLERFRKDRGLFAAV